jgi:hypothetical protein
MGPLEVATILIALAIWLLFIFGLVKFVKWAWHK